jgi:hypothetical protein
VVDGVTLDDNTRANLAIKRAVGVNRNDIKGFEACHLWPGTAYDARYHTVIANLVLLPRGVAGLSDHDADVLAKLQYRAFELYGWHPEEVSPPSKPLNYPTCWREPEPFAPEVAMAIARRFNHSLRGVDEPVLGPQPPRQVDGVTGVSDLSVDGLMPPDELRSVIVKIRRWATRPDTIAHRTIGLVIRAQVPQPRQRLARAVKESTGSSDGAGVVASLLTSKGNAYGRVLIDRDGMIDLHPDVADEIRRHHWS